MSMIDARQYKYDVAFSFLTKDQGLAEEYNNLLRDRFETFVYTERQAELVGTDGHDSFATVFGQEARVVVVLHSDGWGKAGMTLTERVAIVNRGSREDWDFLVLVKIDDAVTPPWVPYSRIYYDLRKYGPEGLAATIDNRVRAMSGRQRPETIAEQAARVHRRKVFAKEREAYRFSERAVGDAVREYERLIAAIQDHLKSDPVQSLGLQLKRQSTFMATLRGDGIGAAIDWENYIANSVRDAELRIAIFKPFVPRPGALIFKGDEPRQVKNAVYEFDVSPGMDPVWRARGTDDTISTDTLANQLLKEFLDHQLAVFESRQRRNS